MSDEHREARAQREWEDSFPGFCNECGHSGHHTDECPYNDESGVDSDINEGWEDYSTGVDTDLVDPDSDVGDDQGSHSGRP